MHIINTDILIIGGGIAGLWLHNRVNQLGFHAILIDNAELGNGQTLSSQGIIHGGAKYTLNGAVSRSATAISAMPDRWRECLDGRGEIDLSSAKILSPYQLMWSSNQLSSKITTFFSSKILRSKITPLKNNQWPALFQHDQFNGLIYRLNEPVLDISSVINCLYTAWKKRAYQLTPESEINFKSNRQQISSFNIGHKLQINAQQYVLAAGEGNESLIKKLNLSSPKMQVRPLHMVLAKGPSLPALYAHAIGASARPIATITTHQHSDGDNVWYIGGNIAETGVGKNQIDQIMDTQQIISALLPWMDLNHLSWTTHRINRAEPRQKDFLKPVTAFLQSINNIHVAWPTKLALAPVLSDKIISQFQTLNLTPGNYQDQDFSALSDFTEPASPAIPLWQRMFNET